MNEKNQPLEFRADCDQFESKRYINQCGSCQTDGHYLCGNCRHIASFENMELHDNRERYYPDLHKLSIALEESKSVNFNSPEIQKQIQSVKEEIDQVHENAKPATQQLTLTLTDEMIKTAAQEYGGGYGWDAINFEKGAKWAIDRLRSDRNLVPESGRTIEDIVSDTSHVLSEEMLLGVCENLQEIIQLTNKLRSEREKDSCDFAEWAIKNGWRLTRNIDAKWYRQQAMETQFSTTSDLHTIYVNEKNGKK